MLRGGAARGLLRKFGKGDFMELSPIPRRHLCSSKLASGGSRSNYGKKQDGNKFSALFPPMEVNQPDRLRQQKHSGGKADKGGPDAFLCGKIDHKKGGSHQRRF